MRNAALIQHKKYSVPRKACTKMRNTTTSLVNTLRRSVFFNKNVTLTSIPKLK